MSLSLVVTLAGLLWVNLCFAQSGPTEIAPPARSGFISEFRLGAFAHDPWSPEKGSVDVNAELLFAKPFTSADPWINALLPQPHLGATLNTGGKTSQAYAGFTWSLDIAPKVFVEGGLSAAIHNGKTGFNMVPPGRNALGCTVLLRESGSIGFRLTENLNLLGSIEHLSNGGLCDQNRGLTNTGVRLGYRF